MTTEADFLAAIAAAPEDATTKLVFADWLEDQGDPRELVRRLAQFAELSDVAESFARARIRPLLERLAGRFAPLLAGAMLKPARRGLLRLVLKADARADAFDLGDPAWGWVGELELDLTTADEGARLAERLDRAGLWVHVHAGWYSPYGGNPDFPLDADWLPWTTSLDLSGLHLDDAALGAILAAPGLVGLRDLRCGFLPRPAPTRLLAEVVRLDLEGLSVAAGSPFAAGELAALRPAPWLGRLRRLALPLEEPADDDVAVLAADGPLARLEELRLWWPDLDTATLRGVLDGPARRALRVLEVDSRRLGPAAVRFLVGCPHLAGLRELTVWDLGGARVCLPLLANAPWPHLAALTLASDDFGRGGLRALLAGSVVPRLLHLGLHAVKVPPTFVSDLASSPGLANLVGLDLSHQPLGEDDLVCLTASPHLSPHCVVNVMCPDATPATVEAFRRRFPNAWV